MSQSTELTIAPEQKEFTAVQRASLAHMGIATSATPSDADLAVFFHHVKRTGLDPFARQCYLIPRQSSRQENGQWIKETKWTIQTGIDGFRLIGHRAAGQSGETVSVEAPEWMHPDGSWRPVWSKAWGQPLAAKVTIRRAGQPFTAVAMFDEYAQTKFDGGLTSMWSQRPAGQIAKCAESAAWRMAFPQDLAGIYSDEEMGQADNVAPDLKAEAEEKETARNTETMLTEAWEDPERLRKLEKWSKQRGAPQDYLDRITARLEQIEPIEAEIVGEGEETQ